MAMSKNTLETELLNLTPTIIEQDVIDVLTNAYGIYASDAKAGGISITDIGVSLGKVAMSAALIGCTEIDAGLDKIPDAVVAFWLGVASGLSSSFSGAVVITPPPQAGLKSGFKTLCPINTAANRSKEEAVSAIAALFHSQAIIGGTATFPGPVTSPIV